MASGPYPPLPDRRALVASSTWVEARPGLAEAAAGWQRTLPRTRRALEIEAAALARPRLWIDTIGSLASTGWKITSAAAPDAPLALLSAAAAATGLPISPPRHGRGTVERAERLVRAGGPAYVKLGQFIASARGLLPDQWVDAFGWCRDEVPALDRRVAIGVVREQLGARQARLRDFEPEPLAAASIAQVHAAILDDGTEVVVKVRRPGLRRQLRTDIETMALVAAIAERLHPAARMANLSGFVELFAALVLQELDFRLEALNLVELAAAFEDAGIDYCTLPRPVPDMVAEGVLVMERLQGVPYTQARDEYGEALDGDRMLRLAIQGVLETTLIYGLFHGDLHAGNVLIDRGERFSLVDFGICGQIDAVQRAALVRFMLAFAQMDAYGQLTALEQFGAIPPNADISGLAAGLQVELDRIGPSSGNRLTFDQIGETLSRVMGLLTGSGFRMPKELVLYFKNLLYLSGFTASVAPDADLLAQIEPILAHFTAKYAGQLSALALERAGGEASVAMAGP
jgi:ubiquinone biosynthesis protein